MDILEEIVAHKKKEVELFKQILPEKDLHKQVEDMLGGHVPSMITTGLGAT